MSDDDVSSESIDWTDPNPSYGPDDGNSDDDSGSSFTLTWSAIKNVAPPWFGKIEALVTTTIFVGGAEFELYKEPVAFIRAVFADGLISGVQFIAGTFAASLLNLLSIITGSLGTSGASVLGSLGSVGDSLIYIIDTLTGVLATLVAAAGPLSPVVVVMIYGGVAVLTAATVRGVLIFFGWAP